MGATPADCPYCQGTGKAGPAVRIIRRSDLARCPVFSLLPSHYNDDGTCKCAEPERS